MKPLVFMYHQAMSLFLGSKNDLNLVHFCVFQTYAVSEPRHIPIEVPPGVWIEEYFYTSSTYLSNLRKAETPITQNNTWKKYRSSGNVAE